MDVYRTEEEQIEAIKKFWAENGTKIVAAILTCIALFFGYQAWERHQLAEKNKVSLYYNELTKVLEDGQDLTEENRVKFDEVFEKIRKEYPKSIYASYAALHKARLEVEKKEFDQAAQSLQWVINAAVTSEIVALANLRLARVEFARGNLDQALNLLQKDQGPFAAGYEEIKGDVLLEQNQPEQALVAYKKARSLQQESAGIPNRILDMKIEALETSDTSKLFPVEVVKSEETPAEAAKSE